LPFAGHIFRYSQIFWGFFRKSSRELGNRPYLGPKYGTFVRFFSRNVGIPENMSTRSEKTAL
jgi:hypothetical protein